jgi:hypothetical protein
VGENLRWNHDNLEYRLSKPQNGLFSIQLTPLEFLNKIAVLIPSPRAHLQHYHGVFASNAPFRKQITAHANKLMEEHIPQAVLEAPAQKITRSYSWAKYLARIYEVFPLICSCGSAIKIIAFITNPYTAQRILNHLKICSNPFDPLPYEPDTCEYPTSAPKHTPEPDYDQFAPEPIYDQCDLIPGSPDGFPEYDDSSPQQPFNTVIRWRNRPHEVPKTTQWSDYLQSDPMPDYDQCDPEPIYNQCDLIPETPDGFPDYYNSSPQPPHNWIIPWRIRSESNENQHYDSPLWKDSS